MAAFAIKQFEEIRWLAFGSCMPLKVIRDRLRRIEGWRVLKETNSESNSVIGVVF